MGNYYDCRLTLRPAVDPVCCPDGYIFSREAILENLLAQKKANKKKLAAWERHQEKLKQREMKQAALDREVTVLAFDRRNHGGSSDRTVDKIQQVAVQGTKAIMGGKQTVSSAKTIKENEERSKNMKAFWVPGQGPEVEDSIEKLDVHARCPASGKPLKMKDLIRVKFKKSKDGGVHEFEDPISGDSFTNASRLVVLKPTGDVVLRDTWKRMIKPDGQYNGIPLQDEDIIELQAGGTGFSEHDKEALQSSKYFALGSTMDRGQSAPGGSRFGLQLN